MDNKLFRKVAYPPLVKQLNELTEAEKNELRKYADYLDDRFKTYDPQVQENWNNIRKKLKDEQFVHLFVESTWYRRRF